MNNSDSVNSGHSHPQPLSDIEIRVKALESLLIEKGYVDPAALDVLIDTYENKIGPKNGAQVVAKAWKDSKFKDWLLTDPNAAIGSMGFTGRQGEHMVVLENTATVHNLVVCTLCSCYPWPVLGIPPVWYKSPEFRAKAVIDPKGVIKDFGHDLPQEVDVRVWDSTAEVRYLVLPLPPGNVDQLTVGELEAIVSRDSMIGVKP
jgi:nitrile hydratase subunit alpha